MANYPGEVPAVTAASAVDAVEQIVAGLEAGHPIRRKLQRDWDSAAGQGTRDWRGKGNIPGYRHLSLRDKVSIHLLRARYLAARSSVEEDRQALRDALLLELSIGQQRFVDLFAGSAAVGNFMATNSALEVWSNDLQRFSAILARSVISRTQPLDVTTLRWAAKAVGEDSSLRAVPQESTWTRPTVLRARAYCSRTVREGFFLKHYGGHYFSPRQALAMDYLFEQMPAGGPERLVAHAAVLRTASKCAAAPGHTAQPFQPTPRLLPYIDQAWSVDPIAVFTDSVSSLADQFAAVPGNATVADAASLVRSIHSSDLVFLDPPYSAAQYGRFYHVLEAVARGGFPSVVGAGRMPDQCFRPRSRLSSVSAAVGALYELLAGLSERAATVVITFPSSTCSNGLSGENVFRMASELFRVQRRLLPLVHSTLGGSRDARGSRRNVLEQVLILRALR
jgi:adenine-specific DNA-methyltransferase